MKNINKSIELKNEVEKIENFKLNDEESKLIIDYMEGHDYIIKSDNEHLYVVDIQDEEDIVIEKIKVIGSRQSGRYINSSDLDILIEYKENIKEYSIC